MIWKYIKSVIKALIHKLFINILNCYFTDNATIFCKNSRHMRDNVINSIFESFGIKKKKLGNTPKNSQP